MSEPELTCRELVELVTDYLEGALDGATRRRVDEHLAACPGCTAYLDEMRVTIRLTGTPDGARSRRPGARLAAPRLPRLAPRRHLSAPISLQASIENRVA